MCENGKPKHTNLDVTFDDFLYHSLNLIKDLKQSIKRFKTLPSDLTFVDFFTAVTCRPTIEFGLTDKVIH